MVEDKTLFLTATKIKKCVIKQLIIDVFLSLVIFLISIKLKICVIVSEDTFLIVCGPDKNKAQRMCDEAVDACLAGLQFFLDCFVTITSG